MGAPKTCDWHVYIAECADGSLYTGIALDITARLETHNRGVGAKYARGRAPLRVVYAEPAANRSAAQAREHAIKRLTRRAKLRLIGGE